MKIIILYLAFLNFIAVVSYNIFNLHIAIYFTIIFFLLMLTIGRFSKIIIIKYFKAKIINTDDNLLVYNLVDKISEQLKINRPETYTYHSLQANSLVCGINKKNSALLLSDSLIENLDNKELTAIITYQLYQIKHSNIYLSTLITCFASVFLLAIFSLSYSAFASDKKVNPLLVMIGVVFLPIIIVMIIIFITRSNIYKYDQYTIKATKDPAALALALYKIHASIESFYTIKAEVNPPVAHLFIVNPLRSIILSRIFLTHPSVKNRIAKIVNYNVEERIKKIFLNQDYFEKPWYQLFRKSS